MKKYVRKIVSFILLVITSFSVVGCKKEDITTPTEPQGKYDLSNTKHVYDVQEGAQPFIVNKTSEYTIVYPFDQSNNKYILNAVSELKNLIFEASGATLKVANDQEKTDNTKILSVGKTVQATSNDRLMKKVREEELGEQGFLLESEGSALYMIGNSAISAMYAAYEFLKWQFDFETYAADEYSLAHNVENMKIKEYHIVDIPDFQSRTACNGEIVGLQGAQFSYRMRTNSEEALFNYEDGNTWCHNYFQLLPKNKYLEEYPEWYADTQLCLNAHGDEESRQKMIETVAEEMIVRLEADTEKNWIAFSHNDGGMWCTCVDCVAEVSLYDKGANTAAFATVTRFTNAVAKIVKAWNLENCPERDIKIFIYNYGKVRFAPVKLDENKEPIVDENGNYLPYSEELMLEDNIAVVYCAFGDANMYEVGHEALKDSIVEYKRISACMKEETMYFWLYSAQFQDYIWPMHTIDTRQDYYQFAKQCNAIALLDMAQYDNAATTDWGALKSYVSAKLLWDCQLDVSEMINDWFEHYFKDASDIMKEMYEEYRSYMKYLCEEKGVVGNVNGVAACQKTEMWPYNIVKHFQSYIDRAYEKIKLLEITDPELYDKLYLRITKESLSWRYVEIYLYPGYFSMEKLEEAKAQFISDAQYAGITLYKEFAGILNIFG